MKRTKFIQYLGMLSLLPVFPKNAFSSVSNFIYDDEKCKLVWKELCGKSSGDKAFEYVSPQKGLPNVFLYGDSISIQYTSYVREALKGKASVFRLFSNGGSSSQFIQYMEEMKRSMFQPYLEDGWDFQWDLIHFNVGLHDLKYFADGKLDKENGKQVSSLEQYRKNLIAICTYLSENYPEATLVWASTTPVPEGGLGRFEGDELKYNRIAMEVMTLFPKIKINDLHSFIEPHFDDWVLKPGNVHYNETGQQEQGKEIARIISKYLSL